MDELCVACEGLGWKRPSAIQREAIPLALKGKGEREREIFVF